MDWRALAVAVLCALGALSARGGEPVFFFSMVRLPGGYWVAKDEVTQAQYQEIAAENPSEFQGPRRPVENVNWEDAQAFCSKLTAREHAAGRLPAELRYDLPTDAQYDDFLGDASIKDAVTSLSAPRDGTAEVGSGRPNSLGLRDVLGNVWEWCRDWYTDAIRRKDANPDIPAGALAMLPPGAAPANPNDPPDERFKVLRGGAWDTTPADGFQPASRLRYAPGMANVHTGFRCVVVREEAHEKDAR